MNKSNGSNEVVFPNVLAQNQQKEAERSTAQFGKGDPGVNQGVPVNSKSFPIKAQESK